MSGPNINHIAHATRQAFVLECDGCGQHLIRPVSDFPGETPIVQFSAEALERGWSINKKGAVYCHAQCQKASDWS